jgi:site-specific recombinase XerD
MASIPAITHQPSPVRKIGRHHIAFFRAWLQGLDIKNMADRYLETGMDVRRARVTLSWIMDVVRMASLRHGKIATARLLRIRFHTASEVDPAQIEKHPPTLAQFREEYDAEEILTQRELIQAFTELYPQSVDLKAAQRDRLINRQLASLVWIEDLLATTPGKPDLISAWFDNTVSDRLVLANINTINDLIDRICLRGFKWWTTVPGLGSKGASRIVYWLRGYEDSLGALPLFALDKKSNLPSTYLLKNRSFETGIVPFESFILPGGLDGSQGSNRHHGTPRIEASTDIEAIQSWLSMKVSSVHTQRAYRKEAERLLLWSVMEKGKAFSDLTVDDCASYRNWLSDLGRTDPGKWIYNLPQSDWISGRHIGRFSQLWRPFSGPVSASSIKLALTIVSGLFEWLSQVQYLSFNPWSAVSRALAAKDQISSPDVELTHVLTVSQWEYLLNFLRTMPDSPQSHQMRFVFELAYITGMRRSELIEATVGRIYSMPLQGGNGVRWMLKVLGKGNKWRAVPITDSLMNTMWQYFLIRGLSPKIQDNPPNTPLIAKQGCQAPLSEDGLHKAVKSVFKLVSSKLLAEGHELDASKFEKASTHWIRHTRGSHLAAADTPIVLIQKLLGHANIATTSIYTKSNDEVLWESLNC